MNSEGCGRVQSFPHPFAEENLLELRSHGAMLESSAVSVHVLCLEFFFWLLANNKAK